MSGFLSTNALILNPDLGGVLGTKRSFCLPSTNARILNPGLGGVLGTNGSVFLLSTKALMLNPGLGGVLGINELCPLERLAIAVFSISKF